MEAESYTLLSDPTSTATKAKASSILNRNSALYGAQHALDTRNDLTCWNSDGSSSNNNKAQVYTILFNRCVSIYKLKLLFQGGFVPEEYKLQIVKASSDNNKYETILTQDDEEFEDCNDLQELDVEIVEVTSIRFVFERSTDFYGRITIYRLECWGIETK